MGVNIQAIKCPHCQEAVYTDTVGPNWTSIAAPTAPGWTVVMLTCMRCKRHLGTYTYPPK